MEEIYIFIEYKDGSFAVLSLSLDPLYYCALSKPFTEAPRDSAQIGT